MEVFIERVAAHLSIKNLATRVWERTNDIPQLRASLWREWAEKRLFSDEEMEAFLSKTPDDASTIWNAFLRYHAIHKDLTQKDAFIDFVSMCVTKGLVA
ncbi:hypothetical protein HZC00_03060 [Candidatus Kaiserbacteria bacterium]|nr:hypothetical protein [Candidatus Kaiserbacteria bacterium]